MTNMKKSLLIITFLAMSFMAMAQEWNAIGSDTPEIYRTQLVSSTERSIKVNVQVPGFYATNVATPRGEAKIISLPKAISTAQAGEPNLPMMGIPAIIGDYARMDIRVLDAQYMDFEGIEVAPSKGDFSREIDPATVPYTYGECYSQDAFFPNNNVDLYEPYIIRDFRGQNMIVYPFSYNPVTKTLRVYYNMTVEMYKVDDNGTNVMETNRSNTIKMSSDFKNVYQRHFINYQAVMNRYTPVDEEGDLLIICYDSFISSMTDFVNWKKTRGINTTIVGTSTAGSTYSAIKSYIQNQYNANNNLTHVLLVGDVGQIPGYTYSGASGYEGKGDNPYGQVAGNDIYNDIFIGRFSAQNTTQVNTQVQRVISYERNLTSSATWCQNGLGVSTTAGNGGHFNEDDYQHVENLRTDLLDFGYSTVYQDYYNVSGYPSSTTTTISNHINSGVGVINYCNHGSQTAWQSHNYTNSHVNALTNDNKLPFIFSVACYNGQYDYSSDCFAEAWMHASNSGTPTGAIGGMFSYISQPWIPPMWAQDEFVDILVESYSNNIKHTFGGAAINGIMAIFDNYNTTTAAAVGTYQAWILFGDPTLMLRTKTPQAMTVNHAGTLPIGSDSYAINVSNGEGALATITDANHNILGSATVSNGTANVNIVGTVTPGDELTLCVFGYNKVTYLGTITAIAIEGPYILLDSYTPTDAHVGDDTDLNISFKNMGVGATSDTTTVTLTPGNSNVTVVNGTGSFGSLAADATTTVSGFSFHINSGVADGTIVPLHYAAVNGNNTWEGDLNITANEAVLEYQNLNWDGGFTPGQTLTLTARFKNTGHYQATNAVATMSSSSNYITINNSPITVGNIGVDEVVSCNFNVTVAANCPETAQIPVTFTLTADGGLAATGSETLKNACNVVFDLADSYGDGWNGASLVVSFDDGTASQSLTFSTGSSASYTLEVGNGVHVTLTWNSGNYDSECSFTVSYEGDLLIYQSSGTPSAGVLYEFNCNCAAAYQTFVVNVTTSNPSQGTVSGGGEFSFGESCTVTATPAEGYMFTGWTVDGEVVSSEAEYTFVVTDDVDLVANFAVGVLIGDGGTATNQYLPSYSYYKHALSQQIYTVAELGEAGTISSIAFYNGGAEKTRTYDFYLKATAKSSFSSTTDWVSVSASDKVFTGSVTMAAGGWTVINFDTPYEYDGISNVVLVADDNSGAYTNAPHMTCRVFNAPNQAIYIYSDNTNYNPTSPSSYTGTLLSVKNQLILIKEGTSVEFFDVTVSANPAEGGTVSGGGEYGYGDTCTVTATANEGYTFVNWTEEGEVVSSEAEYAFDVTGDVDLVANFSQNSYQVSVTASPAEGGVVAVDGGCQVNEYFYDFEDGTTQGWTVFQGPGSDSPDSWMHCTEYTPFDFTSGHGHGSSNGFMLSESFIYYDANSGVGVYPDNYLVSPQVQLGGSISFWAADVDDAFGAEHFAVAVSTVGNAEAEDFTTVGEWTLPVERTGGTRTINDGVWYEYIADLGGFSGMGYVAIRHFDCTEQWMLCVDDITIAEGYDGVCTGTYSHGETCTLTATANEGYTFVNWTRDGEEVSTDATYSFTVTEGAAFVANFEESTVSQTISFTQGVNWCSFNVDITLDELKAALEAAVPNATAANPIVISSQTQNTRYNGTRWLGTLDFDVTKMYRVRVPSGCEIVLVGMPFDPAGNPVSIAPGTNWIAYPLGTSLPVSEVFAGFAVNGDVVKSFTGNASYRNNRWMGDFDLQPGEGYKYVSGATEGRVFTFPTSAK